MTACAKIRYPTRRRARHFARRQRHVHPSLSAYRCRDCGWWHLTSQTAARKTWFRDREVTS